MKPCRIGCALTALGLAACQSYAVPEEITLKRINIVDETGEVRLIIAGAVPDPVVRGEQLPRVIAPAGMIWHDEDGNESGGLVTAPMPDGRLARFITFDFTHQITDAISMGTVESSDGQDWMAGLRVYDRRPYDPGPVESSQGIRRVMLGTDNSDAGLTVMDPQGRDRIRIGVDAAGTATIEILDEDGEVVFRAPD